MFKKLQNNIYFRRIAFLVTVLILALIIGSLVLSLVGVSSLFGSVLVGIGLLILAYTAYHSFRGSVPGTAVVAVDSDILEDELPEDDDVKIVNIEDLGQGEFLELCKELLINQGLEVTFEESLYEAGFQFLARRNGKNFAVRVSHGEGDLDVDIVRQVKAAKRKAKCDGAVILTDGLFSQAARDACNEGKCILVDRPLLEQWLEAYQQSRYFNAT